eukprot:scaffold95215_cov26-Tisochrysis_lutea.AAC.4
MAPLSSILEKLASDCTPTWSEASPEPDAQVKEHHQLEPHERARHQLHVVCGRRAADAQHGPLLDAVVAKGVDDTHQVDERHTRREEEHDREEGIRARNAPRHRHNVSERRTCAHERPSHQPVSEVEENGPEKADDEFDHKRGANKHTHGRVPARFHVEVLASELMAGCGGREAGMRD